MNYRLEKDDHHCTVVVKGDINYDAAKKLKKVFDSLLNEGIDRITLNLKDVPVSSSTGIGTILMLYKNLKQRGGVLDIKGIHPNLLSMLKLVKIDTIIDIGDTE